MTITINTKNVLLFLLGVLALYLNYQAFYYLLSEQTILSTAQKLGFVLVAYEALAAAVALIAFIGGILKGDIELFSEKKISLGTTKSSKKNAELLQEYGKAIAHKNEREAERLYQKLKERGEFD
jgi:hypothetical protein